MSREMERTELIAREQIRDLLSRYTWAGDRGHSAEVAACFTAGGRLDVGDHGGIWEGRPAIEAGLAAVAQRIADAGTGPTRVNHHVSGIHITMHAPTSAEVRSYYCVYTDAGADHWGSYRDEVVLDADDGGWRFAERVVRVTGASPSSTVVP